MGKCPSHPFLNFVDPSAPPFSVRIILMELKYRKIPKISPGAYIFQRPFLRGLFLEGPIYGGKFGFQNRVGLPYKWKEIYRSCLVLLCIWGQFPTTSPPRGLYFGGRFNGRQDGFLRYEFGGLIFEGAYTWRGLFSEFYGIANPCPRTFNRTHHGW